MTEFLKKKNINDQNLVLVLKILYWLDFKNNSVLLQLIVHIWNKSIIRKKEKLPIKAM